MDERSISSSFSLLTIVQRNGVVRGGILVCGDGVDSSDIGPRSGLVYML